MINKSLYILVLSYVRICNYFHYLKNVIKYFVIKCLVENNASVKIIESTTLFITE